MQSIEKTYYDYIDCLNQRELNNLILFVHTDVIYNDKTIGLGGYRDMLRKNYEEIPDLKFTVEILIAGTDTIAVRLNFDCTPVKTFMNLQVNGRRIAFSENVFYKFSEDKIIQVWSVIDKIAIESQLTPGKQ